MLNFLVPGQEREPREPRQTRRDRREATREAWPSSLWRDTNRRFHFPTPSTDIDCDVLVVGAGFSGLWTAHHLHRISPGIRIVIVDAMQPGYGGSGRNGGWCSALYPLPPDRMFDVLGAGSAGMTRRALERTVASIGGLIESSGVEADWAHNGSLTVARNEAQVARLKDQARDWGSIGATDVRWLDAEELGGRIRVNGALGALHDPHCAVLNPYRLLDHLVQDAVEHGVRIFGGTRVTRVGRGFAETRSDTGLAFVTAGKTVIATEAYAPRLEGSERDVVPVYSCIIATEPIPAQTWAEIGWDGREALAEATHVVSYAQRTGDGRLLLGGRGAPYGFGSDVHSSRDTHRRVEADLRGHITRLFPTLTNVRVSHSWGGPVAVPRDMQPSVRINDETGAIHLGGYAGDGVALSNLCARIAAHLTTGTQDECLALPVNGHSPVRWELEPFRWMGINTAVRVARGLDAAESSGREPGPVLRAAARVLPV